MFRLIIFFFSIIVVAVSQFTINLQRHEHRSHTAPWKKWTDKLGPENIPVRGNYVPFGVFYTQISLGTPLRTYNVAIDSGSYRTIVTDVSCTTCNASQAPKYDPTKSSTSKHLTTFSNSYKTCNLKKVSETCTIHGQVYSDHFQLGTLQGTTLNFGAITSQTSNFVQFENIHGLMGLDSIDGTDNFNGPTPIQTLFKGENVYAMCFANNGGGFLTIGGTDSSLQTADFQYTPLEFDLNPSVLVKEIQVGGVSIGAKATSATIDSGTTILLIPGNIYTLLKSAMSGIPHADELFAGKCISTPKFSIYPVISLVLNGTSLSLPPQQYILLEENSEVGRNSSYCLGVINMGRGPSSMFIIGDTILTNYYTVFDRKKNRVGWAPANKSACW